MFIKNNINIDNEIYKIILSPQNDKNKIRMSKLLSYSLLILTMLLWAGNFHVVKIALTYYSPLSVATFRFLFCIITLFFILGIQWKKNYLLLLSLTRKDWWYSFLVGFFGIFLTIYFFNIGLKSTSAINGSLIISTSPAITGLFGTFLLKKPLKKQQWLAITISFFGVVIILTKGDFSRFIALKFEVGDLYIMAMAIVFSYSQILISKHLPHISSIITTSVSSLFALILFCAFSLPELTSYAIPKDFSFWASILFMGVLGSGLAYTAFYHAVVDLGPNLSTLSMNLIPLFTILLASPFGEEIYNIQLLGGFLVIAGLLIYNRQNLKTTNFNLLNRLSYRNNNHK